MSIVDINKRKRVCLAAPRSGSGKTLITCGLIRTFEKMGLAVQCFKAGPDYIDPLFHDATMRSSLHKCENLDTYLADYDTVRRIYAETSGWADISVVEGVMGLYDGLGGTEPEGSTYDLASCLECPVVLVVDSKGASRSLIAEIRGFLDYDNQHLIRGVILNRCSKGIYDRLRNIMSIELRIKALGYLPILGEVDFKSRYLGLELPSEVVDINGKIDMIAEHIKESVDIDGVLEISNSQG